MDETKELREILKKQNEELLRLKIEFTEYKQQTEHVKYLQTSAVYLSHVQKLNTEIDNLSRQLSSVRAELGKYKSAEPVTLPRSANV